MVSLPASTVAEGLAGLRGSQFVAYRFERRDTDYRFIDDISAAHFAGTGTWQLDNDAAVLRVVRGLTLNRDFLPGDFNPTQDNVAIIEQRVIDGQDVDFPLGLFRLQMGEEEFTRGYDQFITCDAMDVSFGLTTSKPEAVTVAASTDYAAAAAAQITALGFAHELTPVALDTPVETRWAPLTSRWTVMHDLADGINYRTPWPDTRGRFVWKPQDLDPSAVSPAVHYRDDDVTGPLMVVDPYRRRLEATERDNRAAVLIDNFEHPDYPYMALRENADPTSPVSTANREAVTQEVRWDSRPRSTRCVLDDDTADAIATTYLRAEAMRYETATLQTLPDPRRGAHEYYRLTLTNRDGSYVEAGTLWRVARMTRPLTPGGRMTHEIQRVLPVAITEWTP